MLKNTVWGRKAGPDLMKRKFNRGVGDGDR